MMFFLQALESRGKKLCYLTSRPNYSTFLFTFMNKNFWTVFEVAMRDLLCDGICATDTRMILKIVFNNIKLGFYVKEMYSSQLTG